LPPCSYELRRPPTFKHFRNSTPSHVVDPKDAGSDGPMRIIIGVGLPPTCGSTLPGSRFGGGMTPLSQPAPGLPSLWLKGKRPRNRDALLNALRQLGWHLFDEFTDPHHIQILERLRRKCRIEFLSSLFEVY
jgi:hypothetical protein